MIFPFLFASNFFILCDSNKKIEANGKKKIMKWIDNDIPLKAAFEEIGMVISSNVYSLPV